MNTEANPPTDERRPGARLLAIRDVVKEFGGNRALDHVSIDVHSGEIVAVLGHNGSGKSTLVKILAGVYEKDGGTIDFGVDDQTQLHIIHQDLGLAAELSAVENIGIARDRGLSSWSPFRTRIERKHAEDLIAQFGATFDVTVPVGTLAPAERSIVAIARSLDGWTRPGNVLILDEPTEALHASEVSVLLHAVKTLASKGTGVIFISHRLDEALQIADRIVVLRDGQKVADAPRYAVDHDRLVTLITGDLGEGDPVDLARRARPEHQIALQVEKLSGGPILELDLTVHRGEIVGVAGVLGSGREAVPGLLYGAVACTARRFDVDGSAYPVRSVRKSIRRGMAYVPGDRAKLGSIRPMTARENLTLTTLDTVVNAFGAIKVRRERGRAEDLIARYDVRPPLTEQAFSQFSGGNQQKMIFAKWLSANPKVLLLEEPTQGVDIGAKQMLYHAVDEAAAAGTAVVVCSSDAKELVRLCDRVLVLRGGEIAAELSGATLTEAHLITEGYGLEGNDES